MSRQAYLTFIDRAVQHHLKESQRIIDDWKKNIQASNLFGYSTTNYPAALGVVLGYRFQQTGDETYAVKTGDLLIQYEEFKQLFPKEFYQNRIEYQKGLPPISDFFDMNAYARAYLYIRSSQKLAPAKRAIIEQGVADCANFLFNFPEWGPMNRAILRAQVLLYSAQALPQHPNASQWQQMAQILAADSYQRWEAEDAASYHPVWLLSLLHYVDAARDEAFFRSAIPRYYLDYFLYQMTPLTPLPDFGDAFWPSYLGRWIPIFEKGAAVYREPRYKWAVQQLWAYQQALDPQSTDLGFARNLIDAIEWGDESLPAEPPDGKSRLVMDEIIGKKVMFRNGVTPQSTYLFLNYRDEGDGAYLFREYMRTTITAEEEKPHHGHSDENAIVQLINQGAILLHDAGYRDRLPSGDYGRYRADYYHNRLVVRKNNRWIRLEEPRAEQSVWEFLRHSGGYRPVQTKLIDFQTFKQVEFSRTRVSDVEMGYEWDRQVVYYKPGDFFVVVDSVQALRRDFLTYTNLWHTQKILATGERWYNTKIENVSEYKAPGNRELLIYFPLKELERTYGTFELTRHNQPEQTIFETLSAFYYENQMEVFVTVLYPHAPDADLEQITKKFQILACDKFPQAVGLQFNFDGVETYLGFKLDLQLDYSHQNLRPRYQYPLGKVPYGPLETDALFALVSKGPRQIYWAASYLTQLKLAEKVLHQSNVVSFGLQPTTEANVRYSPPKWRSWEAETEV